ncbi:right-handed parallel beta-helix repeat-containing protein, partial [bacterium]|nr:right-handed parallel beta-helix repeat-containing protein [bacterium]
MKMLSRRFNFYRSVTLLLGFALIMGVFWPHCLIAQVPNSAFLSKYKNVKTANFNNDTVIIKQVVPQTSKTSQPSPTGIIYVDKYSFGSYQDGVSWASAYRTINDALSAANNGDQIWVAAGTYNENIVLSKGVSLYGGFQGDEDSVQRRKDSQENRTVIDALGAGSVVIGASNSTIDGFILQGGNAQFGGGIYAKDCVDFKVINNQIWSNTADFGGGIMCDGGSPVIRNNEIIENIATDSGGGLFIKYVNNPNALLSHNIISDNRADKGGGIFCFDTTTIPIRNNLISGNTAYTIGGGISLSMHCSPSIKNNVIANNEAFISSGGLYCEYTLDSLYLLTNIINNTFYRNSVRTGTYYGMFFFYGASGNIENTIVSNTGKAVVGSENVIIDQYSNLNDHDPLLIGPPFALDFDYHLSSISPDIDAGNPDPAYNDRDGTRNDLGAYGGQGAGMVGPDYYPPEIDTNDVAFEQEDPNGTVVFFSTPDLALDGLRRLYVQSIGEGPYQIAEASDNDGMPPFLLEPVCDPEGQLFAYGDNEVLIKVMDGYGWETIATAILEIQDTLPPLPYVDPLPTIIEECDANVPVPMAWDKGVGIVYGDTNDPIYIQDQGTHVITWYYDDGRGNVSTQTQTVVIDDVTAPVPDNANLPAIQTECSF